MLHTFLFCDVFLYFYQNQNKGTNRMTYGMESTITSGNRNGELRNFEYNKLIIFVAVKCLMGEIITLPI